MANLDVNPAKVEHARKWLDTVHRAARTPKTGGFSAIRSAIKSTPCRSAIGLLITQYLGADEKRSDNHRRCAVLMENMPDLKARDTYSWYYATQVMHNMCDADWDTWNRKMRKILVETQCKTGCAAGSWDPVTPTKDSLGRLRRTA